jgi:hypothetical protein
MQYYLISPAEFLRIIDEFGSLSALANMASYFEKTPTEPYEDWEKEYFVMEAERLLAAINKLPNGNSRRRTPRSKK